MLRSKITGVFAGMAMLLALACILFSLYELPPRINPKPHAAVGLAMAKLALGFLEPGGDILVITRDTSAFKQPALDCQLDSFQRALADAHAKPATVQLLQVDPLRPVEVPAGDFLESIRKAPKGGVIVSFMGPPLLSDEQRQKLGAVKPKIVAFCAGSLPERAYLKTLFEQGLLHAAVVDRRDAPAIKTQPKDLQGWFDALYLTVTSANLARLTALEDTTQVSR